MSCGEWESGIRSVGGLAGAERGKGSQRAACRRWGGMGPKTRTRMSWRWGWDDIGDVPDKRHGGVDAEAEAEAGLGWEWTRRATEGRCEHKE